MGKSLLKIPFCEKGLEESLKIAGVLLILVHIRGLLWVEIDIPANPQKIEHTQNMEIADIDLKKIEKERYPKFERFGMREWLD